MSFLKSWYFPFLILSMTPIVSSATALIMGFMLSLGLALPLPGAYKKLGKLLLQLSIVALGFDMEPKAVWRAGIGGIGLTFFSIAFTLVVAYLLARQLRILNKASVLIAVGTAICGGSAIAAVGPVIAADADEMSVALAIVFLLNAAALLVFPFVGTALHMLPEAFGAFAAIAIHDTSSVVGAATKFSDLSIPVAVTIKLTRALWIIPLSLVAAFVMKRRSQGSKSEANTSTVPWFIVLFALAVGFRALVPQLLPIYTACGVAGKAGLKGAIFIFSSQMTRPALRKVGHKPLVLAMVLWATIIAAGLLAVYAGVLG